VTLGGKFLQLDGSFTAQFIVILGHGTWTSSKELDHQGITAVGIIIKKEK